MVAQKAVDDAVASGTMVLISCHHCGEQFAPASTGEPLAGPYKTGRAASIAIKNCSACQQPISVPDPFPDAGVIDMVCPLCDSKLDIDKLRQQDTADEAEEGNGIGVAECVENGLHITLPWCATQFPMHPCL